MTDMQSALDAMTASTRERKEDKAAGLTPVAMERAAPFNVTTTAPFPNDHPMEAIESAVKAIRREVQYIIEALDAIDATNGVPAEPPADQLKVQQARERAADASFAEKFAAQKAAAQAATFGVPAAAPPPSGWVCPTHGATALTRTVSRRRGDIVSCSACSEYER